MRDRTGWRSARAWPGQRARAPPGRESPASPERLPPRSGRRRPSPKSWSPRLHETGSRALVRPPPGGVSAAELAGPSFGVGVEMEVHDAMAKGTAQKRFSWWLRRFTGEPYAAGCRLAPVGWLSLHARRLYLARGADGPAIQVSCAGTLVADDIGGAAHGSISTRRLDRFASSPG